MFNKLSTSTPRVLNTTSRTLNRNFTSTTARMGVTVYKTQEGSGASPKVGDKVVIEYTGYLKDTSKPGNKGDKFDSSVGRGPFECRIGVGQVIKGWDEGVVQMKTGEKATLDITSDYAYGDQGFPGHIPARADLIFDVELKRVN